MTETENQRRLNPQRFSSAVHATLQAIPVREWETDFAEAKRQAMMIEGLLKLHGETIGNRPVNPLIENPSIIHKLIDFLGLDPADIQRPWRIRAAALSHVEALAAVNAQTPLSPENFDPMDGLAVDFLNLAYQETTYGIDGE